LNDFLRQRLANYKVPKSFTFRPLPLLASGKVDKLTLEKDRKEASIAAEG
jgi:acyl-CoA synthetase (AMP-forming)/AMP-acid ligase II